MLDFLAQNWQYIAISISLLSTIISIIILRVKSVPVRKLVKVISLVPQIITNAESVFPLSNEGRNKKDLVKSLFNDLLVAYGVEKYSKYIDIDNFIEEVLECPTKKLD